MPIDPPDSLTAILGSLHTASCVLTFLDTDEGLTGEGLGFSINNKRLGMVILEMIRQLEDLVVGMDPRMGGALNAKELGKELILVQGMRGFRSSVWRLLDNALWDLRGKAAGLNVALSDWCLPPLLGFRALCQWRAVARVVYRRVAEAGSWVCGSGVPGDEDLRSA